LVEILAVGVHGETPVAPFRTSAPVLVVFLFACPALAQPMPGEPQPDCLHLGVVYVRATVEASFLVREPGIKPEVIAPNFVTVQNKFTEIRPFGREGKNFLFGSVEIGIDTTTAGEFSGELTVTLGQTTAKVPVNATVKAGRPGLRRILIVETPFEKWSTSDGTMFQAWTELVKDSPFAVNYLLIHRGKPVLRDLDLDAGALVNATPADVKRARAYAENGGRVVVAANYFFRGMWKRRMQCLTDTGSKCVMRRLVGWDGATSRSTRGATSAHGC
jgi:hypothetical protein